MSFVKRDKNRKSVRITRTAVIACANTTLVKRCISAKFTRAADPPQLLDASAAASV